MASATPSTNWVGRLTAWGTLAMVAVTFTIVVLRYLFNLGWIVMQESVTYLHAMIFMLGAAYTFKHDGHVRVDISYQKASARGRAWVDLLGTLLLLLPFCLFLLWVSWDYVAASWALREGSRDSGGLPCGRSRFRSRRAAPTATVRGCRSAWTSCTTGSSGCSSRAS